MGETNGLKKELSLTSLIAMASGGMVAAWMVEIRYWFELTGVTSALALLVCALLILPLCFIYTEMTAMLPYAGGANIWATNAFNWDAGFFTCWALLLLYIMAMSTVTYGIASMLTYFFPVSFMQTKILAVVLTTGAYFLANRELKILAKIQGILYWSTLVVSVGASLIFVFNGNWSIEVMKPFFPMGSKGFTAAIALLMMKFIGFDLIPQLSEETNFPKNKLWIAFIGAIGLTVLIYGMAVIGVGGIFTTNQIINTDVVDPRVADYIGKHWLAIIIVIMGCLVCITTIPGFWLSASRTLYGASKQHQMTRLFGVLNKEGQPINANITVGVLAMFFTVFAPDKWVNYIYTIYGITAGIVYFIVTISFVSLRIKKPQWNRPYKVKVWPLVALISCCFTLWVIYTCFGEISSGSLLVLGIYFSGGIFMWIYAKIMQKKKPVEWKKIIISPDTDISEEEILNN